MRSLYDHQIIFPSELSFSIKDLEEEIESITALDCFSIVNSGQDLNQLRDPRFAEWSTNENFIIFGAGGSSLGGQCISSVLKNSAKNIKYVYNSDPATLDKLFSRINPQKTGFLCISKSGETLETICQVLLAQHFVKEKNKFVFITENKESSLKEMANTLGCLCLDHPKNIGGRFSVFSLTGMVPALLSGVDPLRMRIGGARALVNYRNRIREGIGFIRECIKNNITQHVSFIYSDKLQKFGPWLAQLYAESTGKSGRGITPLTAIGATDQHSQLQLYLDGPRDKCFTFIEEEQNSKLRIPVSGNIPYLKNRAMRDVFKAQCAATIASIQEKGAYIRKINVSTIVPEMLGALFMHFMVEVVIVCKTLGVNPFDQPAVERGKVITKKLIIEC
ncbi:MAG: hypothetical protein LBF57_03465 [Holosporaceae bacterium]|jgi:glucose-6-phosphate isomerase|nr:hypothetical protein [Holosporaceae bacterium]